MRRRVHKRRRGGHLDGYAYIFIGPFYFKVELPARFVVIISPLHWGLEMWW